MLLTLSIHYSRVSDIVVPDHLIATPSSPISAYRDSFGNWVTRILAPKGEIRLSTEAIINDSGTPDLVAPWAQKHPVESLPEEALIFLLGSRYCETDRLSQLEGSLFSNTPVGWERVQAVCYFVHNHVAFGFEQPSRAEP